MGLVPWQRVHFRAAERHDRLAGDQKPLDKVTFVSASVL